MFDKLNPVPALDRPDLLAPPTLDAVRRIPQALVIEIDPAVSDTDAFCAAHDLPGDVMGNAALVMGKRQGEVRQCCALVLATRRIDVNGFVRRTLDVRSASFAPMDVAVAASGMEYGGITPVGLGPEWPVWLDETVRDVELLVIGSGVRRSKLLVPGAALLDLPGARLMPGLTLG
jgi:prolyl-tRNA editing enzyme YbaK/EbsC (Cys-tRNA(Pro) deacylase)